jgi:hypothetical protein
MKVKELIEKLQRFDPELHVAAYLEWDDVTGVFEIDVPAVVTACRRSENGGIAFVSPNDPFALKVVLLGLDEA